MLCGNTLCNFWWHCRLGVEGGKWAGGGLSWSHHPGALAAGAPPPSPASAGTLAQPLLPAPEWVVS